VLLSTSRAKRDLRDYVPPTYTRQVVDRRGGYYGSYPAASYGYSSSSSGGYGGKKRRCCCGCNKNQNNDLLLLLGLLALAAAIAAAAGVFNNLGRSSLTTKAREARSVHQSLLMYSSGTYCKLMQPE
jgi:hypothetical protein